jgi:hypothetical protein
MALRALSADRGRSVNAELEGYADQRLSIKQDAPGLASGLSAGQFNWRPAPSRSARLPAPDG